VWALRTIPVRVETFVGQAPGWSAEGLGSYAWPSALVIDAEKNVFVLTQDDGGYRVNKIDADGEELWTSAYSNVDVPETGHSVAVLPNGGAIVAGSSKGSSGIEHDGLLTWHTSDGEIMQALLFDGEADEDSDTFHGVVVSAEGYAVTVGTHKTATHTRLWLLKVAI
jgi:hypothetical protein